MTELLFHDLCYLDCTNCGVVETGKCTKTESAIMHGLASINFRNVLNKFNYAAI